MRYDQRRNLYNYAIKKLIEDSPRVATQFARAMDGQSFTDIATNNMLTVAMLLYLFFLPVGLRTLYGYYNTLNLSIKNNDVKQTRWYFPIAFVVLVCVIILRQLFFNDEPPLTKAELIDAQQLIREHARKVAIDCEENLNKTFPFLPPEMQKRYSQVKDECWRDWRRMQDLIE
jgi:hypothetical protein